MVVGRYCVNKPLRISSKLVFLSINCILFNLRNFIFIISGSEETKRGCEKINEIRIEKGFQPLDIHLIKLVDDSCHDLGPIFYKTDSVTRLI